MDEAILIIVVIAMIVFYKLMSQIITVYKEKHQGPNPKTMRRAEPMSLDEAESLRMRAQELQRRLHTLEEIIAAEKRSVS